MPIGPRGERLPYPGEAGAGQAAGPPFDPRAMNPGVGTGPNMPPMNPGGAPQMPPIEAVVARIQELQAELQQLMALAEQMGAGGQPGMGGRTGPDLPQGVPVNASAGIDATNAAMGPGLLA